MHQSSNQSYFTEVFDINLEYIPQLYSYQLKTRGSSAQDKTGRKISDRLTRIFGGHWVWADDVIVSDVFQPFEALEPKLKEIRLNEKDAFKDLANIVPLSTWQPTMAQIAEFTAQGLFNDYAKEFHNALLPATDLDSKAIVERHFDIRGWVVKDKPSIAISVDSRLIFKQDLKTYAKQLNSPEEMIGIFVCDKVPYENGSYLKGEIVSIAGQLDIDIPRQDLLDITKRDASKPLIQNAAQGEYVVHVGHGEHQYVISALRIVLYPKHYRRFGIDTKKAQNATWIKPTERVSFVRKVSEIAKARGLINNPYMSGGSESTFVTSEKYKYDPTTLVGNGRKIPYNKGGSGLINSLSQHGLYQIASNLGTIDQTLRIGMLNAAHINIQDVETTLSNQLKQLGFVRTTFVTVDSTDTSRIAFEKSINKLLESDPHVIVAIIPDSNSSDEDDWGPYYDFKSLMMNLGIPSQVIDRETATRTKGLAFAMQNIALGMLAKMGHIPYVLANSIDYADIVVGIDIARKRNKNGIGSQNAAAISQVFQKTGSFINCRVVDTPIEGETVPAKILRSLFPLNEFENKRVIIHRDGLFRGDEINIIQDHCNKIGATVYFVEVIKSGAPRLYMRQGNEISAPGIGTAFVLSDTEAFLVSSESSTATPQPLQIRTQAPFTIGKALHSVLMLTLMHFGSLRRPKSPVTIHYSDKIGYLALRGVKPVNGQSTDMYWL